MKSEFSLSVNAQICGYIPTELSALSNSVTGWDITTGNDLGTPCCELLDRFNVSERGGSMVAPLTRTSQLTVPSDHRPAHFEHHQPLMERRGVHRDDPDTGA